MSILLSFLSESCQIYTFPPPPYNPPLLLYNFHSLLFDIFALYSGETHLGRGWDRRDPGHQPGGIKRIRVTTGWVEGILVTDRVGYTIFGSPSGWVEEIRVTIGSHVLGQYSIGKFRVQFLKSDMEYQTFLDSLYHEIQIFLL